MPVEPPAEIHLTSQREAWWMLFPAGVIGLITVAAWLSTVVGDGDRPAAGADWTTPVLGTGGLIATPLLCWVGVVTMERAIERRRVLRVYAQGIARWPQYATEAQWRQVIATPAGPAGGVAEVTWQLAIPTVVVAAIGVVAVVQGVWTVAAVLVAFWLGIAGLLAGRRWNQERERRNDRRRRERLLPYPSCCLSAEGIYHEDWGLVGLEQVVQVRIVPPEEVPQVRKRLLSGARKGELIVELDPFDSRLARAGWSLLQITLDSQVARTLRHRVQALLRTGQHGFQLHLTILHVCGSRRAASPRPARSSPRSPGAGSPADPTGLEVAELPESLWAHSSRP